MEKLFYLRNAITLIEKTIFSKINVDQIASGCFVSTRQLYRDFYSLTGHTVHEYVRKRRLSNALHLLKYTHMSMVEIAYSSGYSSQAAFCQTIQCYLHMTATEYRNGEFQYYFPVFNCKVFRQLEVKTEIIPKCIIVHYYDNSLVGIENRAIAYWYSIAPEFQGRIFGRNEKQDKKGFCYELMIEYSEEIGYLIQNTRCKVIGIKEAMETLFVMTVVKNDEAEINGAWEYLYNQWLKNSMFEQEDMEYFEEYIMKGNSPRKLILYLPVRSKNSYFRVSIVSCEDRLFLVSTKTGVNAEKLASDTVIDYINKQYPYLLETQKEYYISNRGSSYTCGIRLNEQRYIPDDGSIELILADQGTYAMIEGPCYGDNCEYERILKQWISGNGLEVEGDYFTIYDTSYGINRNALMVKSYIKLKWQKNIIQFIT